MQERDIRRIMALESLNNYLMGQTCDTPDFVHTIRNAHETLSQTPQGRIISEQAEVIMSCIQEIRLQSKIQTWLAGGFALWTKEESDYVREHYPGKSLLNL